MFSLESPEYAQHTIINIKITVNYPIYDNACSYGMFSYGPENVVNEPSVIEPLKVGSWSFECIIIFLIYFLNCRKALFTRK